jgi:hypothetical protein
MFQVLLFHAYFKQTVHESPDEHFRVRPVKVYYYLEDDSISVVEPLVPNSGIPQGKLIKRQQLPKDEFGATWHWKDLNLGIDVTFYGKMFHIYDCDKWTYEFMSSEGIELSAREPCPSDPYTTSRQQPLNAYSTPSDNDKLKQFLELDRKVLCFHCLWDDRDSMFGEIRPYVLHYYLVDDTIEVREVHEANDGRDPFPVLVCRQRLPKNRKAIPASFPSSVMEYTEDEVKEWLSPKDFGIGKTINILGRKFIVCDCDDFTKNFYRVKFGVTDFAPVKADQPVAQPVKMVIPPYNGFGSPEDSLQSCLSLIPQPPKKDFIKMLENDGKILRFAAVMDSPSPEDENRKFIISYRLSDEMMSIYEPPQRNAGILGGKFLEFRRVAKPGTQTKPCFYSPQDFAVGSTIEVLKHKFIITDADLYVLKYMEANKDQFPDDVIESLRKKHPQLTQ